MINQKNVSPYVSTTAKSKGTGSDNIIIDAEDFNSVCPASAINLSLLTRTILHQPENENRIRGIVG